MTNKTGYIDIHHHIIPEFYLDALKEAGIDKAGGLKSTIGNLKTV
ncbi:amidohydrolase [Staphylococcus argenteus]|nr:amidohydrolase [Staphylococcus argenteus]BBN30834.1 hypothetical protein KUH140087_1705 [Staphylococcus aureus]